MPLETQDNRIRFDAPRIDFAGTVGLSGKDHDNFPEPNSQARYDWMRMFLIGLLSNQSSLSEPNEHRDGTLWFDKNDNVFKVSLDGEWVSLAKAISIVDSNGTETTLGDWYTSIASVIANVRSEIVFSGECTQDGVSNIPVPESMITNLNGDSRCFIYKNGLLIDPRSCTLLGSPAATVKLTGTVLDDGDTFIAVIRPITSANFYATKVTIP
jgi:hypothetical protein